MNDLLANEDLFTSLLTAGVTLLVGFGTAWLAIGTRERRTRTILNQEYELLSHLEPEGPEARRLEALIKQRLNWYLTQPERQDRRILVGIAFVAATGLVVGTFSMNGYLDFDSPSEAIKLVAEISVLLVPATLLCIQVFDNDSPLSRFLVHDDGALQRWLRRNDGKGES